MAENSKILLGLPNLPADQIDPKFWGEFLLIYRAIQNLLLGVSRYSGIDDPDTIEVATTDPASYLLGANFGRYYPRAVGPVFAGQLLCLRPDVGAHWVSQAVATTATRQAFCIALEPAAAGQTVPVLTMGITTAIGGMIPGTLYYLSTVPGAVQNLRPVNPGEIIQPVGWALTSGQLYLNFSPYYHQL